jgi:hypothetical protein
MIPAVPICCRCDQSIQPTEQAREHVHDRPSGAPLVEYSHMGWRCPAPVRHPAPAAGVEERR